MLIKKNIFLAFINKNNLAIWRKMITLCVGLKDTELESSVNRKGKISLADPARYNIKKTCYLSQATRFL
jgi:hypothetical protein